MIGPTQQSDMAVLTELLPHQKYVAVGVAVFILLVVLELVRKRKLREEYTWLWIGTSAVLMALALQPSLLSLFQTAIGAKTPIPALFSGALVFLMMVALMISVRVSRLTFRSKRLNRELSLQRQRIDELSAEGARLKGEQSPATGDAGGLTGLPPKRKAKGGAA